MADSNLEANLAVGERIKRLREGANLTLEQLAERIGIDPSELKRIEDCGTSPLLQAALHVFLREGGLDEHLRRVRPVYRERRDLMLRALERHLPPGAAWTRPAGGLFVWVTMPEGFDGDGLFVAAQRRGVLYSRGELFHSDGTGRNAFRLTYSTASPAEIEAGVEILGGLIRERWPAAEGRARQPAAETMPIF